MPRITESFLFSLEITLSCIICALNTFELEKEISLLFHLTYFMLAFHLLVTSYKNMFKLFLLLVFLTLNILISTSKEPYLHLNFEYLKKSVFFFFSLYYFIICTQGNINKKSRKVIITGITCAASYLIVDYFFFNNRIMFGHYLSLGFSNSNITAMWLLHLIFFMVYFFAITQKKIFRIVYASAAVCLTHLLFFTGCRSTMLCLTLFLIMLLFGFNKNKVLYYKIVLIVIVLFPFLVTLLYITGIFQPYLNQTVIDTGDMEQFQGKSIDARGYIWEYAFSLIRNGNFIIGNYAGLYTRNLTGMTQMHNSHLDTLVSYGLIPFILFLDILYDILDITRNKVVSFPQHICFCSFICIIILGCFEAGIFTGCLGLFYLSGLFLVLINTNADISESNKQMIDDNAVSSLK